MSKFLGPIHFWLYNKINIQQRLTEELAEKLLESGRKEQLFKELDDKVGTLPTGSLEDNIDTMNIHGWLQEKIGIVEVRMGYVVNAIKEAKGSLEEAGKISYEFGKGLAESGELSVEEGYKLIEDNMLSGMPCDRVNGILEQDQDSLTYEQAVEIHDKFWSQASADVKDYYFLRDEMIKGMLSKVGLSFEVAGENTYKIKK